MNNWPAEVGNLAECHQPLFDWMSSIVPSGERTAKVHYGCRGWVVHHLSDPFGFTTPAHGVWGVWPMGGAWLAQHAWEHFAFGGDKTFLSRQGYPLIKAAAQFVLDFLVEAPAGTPAAGKLVPSPSHSPENSFRKPDGTVSQFTYAATMDLEEGQLLGPTARRRPRLPPALQSSQERHAPEPLRHPPAVPVSQVIRIEP